MSSSLVVIAGPTASGKSDLAILLALKYNGEIISADSRQVYQGMDLGSGKVTSGEQNLVPHHLLDVASPKRGYNVTHFLRDAEKALEGIQKRGKQPIVCGGTGFWIQALLAGNTFPEVKPNRQLRQKLGKKNSEELWAMLRMKDPRRAASIDAHNSIRLIRALEIIEVLGRIPKAIPSKNKTQNFLLIALNPGKKILQENIKRRLDQRLEHGMVEEIARLRSQGVSWKRLESFGLEYKNVALFLQGKIDETEMKRAILTESWQYARRQLSYLRRWEKQGARILWAKNQREAEMAINPAVF